MNLRVKRSRDRHRRRLSSIFRTIPGTGNVWYRECDRWGHPTDVSNRFWGIRMKRIFDS